MKKYLKFLLLSVFIAILAIGTIWGIKIRKKNILAEQQKRAVQEENDRCQEIILGLVSDIHAGNERERKVDGIVLNYPNKYDEHFTRTLREMKEKNIDLVISAGDNTNVGKGKYARHLKQIADEAGFQVIWVRGNHDRAQTNTMSNFGLDKTYYYHDYCDWRFIALDTNVIEDGGLGKEQTDWLLETLKTDKNIIIVMHHPIWKEDNPDLINEKRWAHFEELVSQNPQIKHIMNGHYHTDYWHKSHKGIEYHFLPSLTRNKDNPTYEIIKL